MNCLAKPKQGTGEPEAPARASVPERFRRLKWNEVVWPGDFVVDEFLGLHRGKGLADLGLVYDCHLEPLGAPDRYKVGVKITLPRPAVAWGRP